MEISSSINIYQQPVLLAVTCAFQLSTQMYVAEKLYAHNETHSL